MTTVLLATANELQDLVRTVIRQEISGLSAFQPENKKYLTIEEAAEFLKIPKSTLYQFTSQRLIPHTKSGRRVMFMLAELEGWLVSRRKATRQEIENEVLTKKHKQK